MPVIGITGSLGAGKSIVAGMFHKHGAVIFDADKEIHTILSHDSPAVKVIAKALGLKVASSSGLDHAQLADIVFNDPSQMQKLSQVLHPLVKCAAQKFIAANHRKALLVLDVPLLIEAGWQDLVDKVLVVRASRDVQLQRVKSRSRLTKSQALKRLKLQMPLKEKIKYADFIVDNRGTKAETYKQVKTIINNLEIEYSQWTNRREL